MNSHTQIDRLIEGLANPDFSVSLEAISSKLDLNEMGSRGRTALMVAAAEGLADAVKVLIQKGASVTRPGNGLMTALHEAAANGHACIVDLLLEHGANVNAQTVDGVTPLMCSAAWGHLKVAQILIECGADATMTDRTGASAADIAREKGEDLVAHLIEERSTFRD
jgi:ankyrin repeat protein